MKPCCTFDCQQGRDCPHRPDQTPFDQFNDLTDLIAMRLLYVLLGMALAATIILAAASLK